MENHSANMLTDNFCIFGALEQGFMSVSDGSSSKKQFQKKMGLLTYALAFGCRLMYSFSISNFFSLVIQALHCVHSAVGPHMASLQELLQNAGVQDTFVDKLAEDGWTIELFLRWLLPT